MNTSKSKQAFTLIELLLVLVILASLAAIVVPKFTKRAEQAHITQAITQIANFETALDAFNIDIGRYPTTLEGLEALIVKPAGLDRWKEPYLKRQMLPKDPWGNEYQYKCPGEHNQYDYDIYSFGPDGRQGGDDDIDNWSNKSSS